MCLNITNVFTNDKYAFLPQPLCCDFADGTVEIGVTCLDSETEAQPTKPTPVRPTEIPVWITFDLLCQLFTAFICGASYTTPTSFNTHIRVPKTSVRGCLHENGTDSDRDRFGPD